MSKKENKLIVFRDEVSRKNIYKLNGVDVSDAIENLLEKHEKEIIDTKCKLFHLDLGVHSRYQKRIADLEAKLADSEEKCKKAYQEGLLQKQFDKDMEIEQLKHKLTESENKYIDRKQFYVSEICHAKNTINNLLYENNEFKQQLAEKEKEIDELQDKLHSYYEEIMNKGTCGLCEYVRNDYKIDYALEQLERVKNYIVTDEKDMFGVTYLMKSECVYEFIDQLIIEIKEGK